MSNPVKDHPVDNGGRRRFADRRSFSYAITLPERRRHQERRLRSDRRTRPRVEPPAQPAGLPAELSACCSD